MTVKRKLGWPPPKKSLGQVMLVDSIIAHEIVAATGIEKSHNVLEIGPGRGILTDILLRSGAEITCCELDARMAELLRKRFGRKPNFRLILGDIMELDLEVVFPGRNFWAMGNLPYHLTSEILFKFFDYIKSAWDNGVPPRVESLTVMVQREVADRLLSQPGSREWGILSIYTSLFGEVEKIIDVPPDCFKPQPRVDSTVVKISFRGDYPFTINDYELFRKLIKASFGNRRKMLKNTLGAFNPPADIDFDLHKRPEELTAEDFAFLAGSIKYANRGGG